MATKNHLSLLENHLLQAEKDDGCSGDGSVDFHGNTQFSSKTLATGGLVLSFSVGNECCERLAYYGIATNLVTYLTDKLHQGNASAARNATTWAGTCYLTPLIGAFLADVYWGRYWTVAVFTVIYFIGVCMLTLSATIPEFLPGAFGVSIFPSSSSIFFMGLGLVALGSGGIKPCVSSFGADQFDDTDPTERTKKGSFFNWFYISINIGSLISCTFIVWVQENAGWGLGYGIVALFMGMATIIFFSGTPFYRFQRPEGSPITRLCQVLVASFRKRNLVIPHDKDLLYETFDRDSAGEGSRKLEHTDELRCLDKAAIVTDAEIKCGGFSDPWRLCTTTQVEELKILIRMLPIWSTVINYSTVYFQMSSVFVEQGKAVDRKLRSYTIPAASLSTFEVIGCIFTVLLYESILVPVARNLTGKERGISQLQRIGIGLFISILAMAAAALVEIKRLNLAREIELSILWQIPQYCLVEAADAFTSVGKLEFFYEQSPVAMRSLCAAAALLTSCVGGYLSSLIVTVVSFVTTAGGEPGWIANDLNKGHLDYYLWLMAGLGFLNLIMFVVSAKRYKQKKAVYRRGSSVL